MSVWLRNLIRGGCAVGAVAVACAGVASASVPPDGTIATGTNVNVTVASVTPEGGDEFRVVFTIANTGSETVVAPLRASFGDGALGGGIALDAPNDRLCSTTYFDAPPTPGGPPGISGFWSECDPLTLTAGASVQAAVRVTVAPGASDVSIQLVATVTDDDASDNSATATVSSPTPASDPTTTTTAPIATTLPPTTDAASPTTGPALVDALPATGGRTAAAVLIACTLTALGAAATRVARAAPDRSRG